MAQDHGGGVKLELKPGAVETFDKVAKDVVGGLSIARKVLGYIAKAGEPEQLEEETQPKKPQKVRMDAKLLTDGSEKKLKK
jgi:hypothetical protein